MTPDNDDQSQTMTCKTCGETFPYKRETVLGLRSPDANPAKKSKVVYLTCPNGHTLPYTVTEG